MPDFFYCSDGLIEWTVGHEFHAANRAGIYRDGLVGDDLFNRGGEITCLERLTLDEIVPIPAARAADSADVFTGRE